MQPILNKGANRTRLRVARAQQTEALLNSQTAVLTGGRDRPNSLYPYQAASER